MTQNEEQKSMEQKSTSGDKSISLPAFGLAEEILGSKKDKEKERPANDIQKLIGTNGSAGSVLMKYVTFYLGEEEYALPISQVQEINRVVEITRVPNAPDHVMGVINLRGKIIPVIELKKRLSLGTANITKDSRIVVFEQGVKIIGLMVDRVSQVLNITNEQIEAAPEEAIKGGKNYIGGIGKIDDRMILLLDLEQVIGKAVTQ